MNRIEKVFTKLKENKDKAFIPYIMAGDGGISALKERILFLEKCGATAIEIGIPFSDPVADGPVIQEAAIRALKKGTTLKGVISAIREIRPIVSIPLVIMTYMNPIYAYGINRFIEDAVHAGIDGFIIPDLPIEEEGILLDEINKAGIELIRLVTLTSPKERIVEIASRGKGFLYAVTVTGITGVRTDFHTSVSKYLEEITEHSPIPVLAGFGISSPEQIVKMSNYCDGVIVGSKIVQLFHENNLEEIEKLITANRVIY